MQITGFALSFCLNQFHMAMDTLPKGLKIALYCSTVTGLLYGSMFFVLPYFTPSLLGWEMTDPGYRILGASIIGIAIATWLAARSNSWAQARIVVVLQIVWPVLGSISSIWGVTERALPTAALANAVFGFVFAGVFLWYWRNQSANEDVERELT